MASTNDGWEDVPSNTKPSSKSGGWEDVPTGKASKPSSGRLTLNDLVLGKSSPQIETTALGTFGRSATESAATVPGAMYGAGVGARVGAALAPFTGPFSPAMPFIGGVGGGLIASVAQSYGINTLEQFVDTVFGTNIMATKAAQSQQHPVAEKVGGFAGLVAGPGGAFNVPRLTTKEGLKHAGIGASVMAGIGGTQRAFEGQDVFSPLDVASDVATGVFAGPSKLGKKLIAKGEGKPFVDTGKPDLPPRPDPGKATPEEIEAFKKAVQAQIQERLKKVPLAEAAIRNKETGEIERMGPKHDEARKAETANTHEQGFVDEKGNFLNRKQAWERAVTSGQIPEGQVPENIKDGLHSGDLRKAGVEAFKIKEEQPTGEPKPPEDITASKGPATREEYKKHIEDLDSRIWQLESEHVSLDLNDPAGAKRAAEIDTEQASIKQQIDAARKAMPEVQFANPQKPKWDELHDFLWGSRTVGEAFDKIIQAKDVGSTGQRLLVQALSLSNHIRFANLEFSKDYIGYTDKQGTYKKDAMGLYSPDKHLVNLGKHGGLQTFLHESIHAGTVKLMREGNSNAAVRLKELYNKYQEQVFDNVAREHSEFWKNLQEKVQNGRITEQEARKTLMDYADPGAAYGLTNELEFVAEAFTNKHFQRRLGQIRVGEQPGPLGTLWGQFKETIRKGLNIPEKARTALDEVFDTGISAIKHSEKYAPSNAATGTAAPAIPPQVKQKLEEQKRFFEKKAELQLQRKKEWDQLSVAEQIKRGKLSDPTEQEVLAALKKESGASDKTLAALGRKDEGSGGGSVPSKVPDEAKDPTATPAEEIDRTKINPRDVQSEKEFMDIAAEIYEKHGETETMKFFEGYRAYKETWKQPIAEVEKFVGINLRSKAANERIIHNEKQALIDALPDAERREAVAEAIDSGDLSGLSPQERAVADRYSSLVKDIGERAKEKGVINGLLENYVSHILEWKGAPPTLKEELMYALFSSGAKDPTMSGMSVTSKFGKERKIPTFAQLEAWLQQVNQRIEASGKTDFRLRIKTKDIAEVYKEYALSMEKAMENKSLIENLKQIRNPAGEAWVREVTPDKPLTPGYTVMDAPQLSGLAVHQDMVPALKFVFDAGPGDLMKALGAITNFTKRMNVIGSFFHAKSLMEVMSSAQIPLWTPFKEAIVLPAVEKTAKAFGKDLQLSAITKAVEQFKEGGVGSNVDKWIREGGLQLEMPEDISKKSLSQIGAVADMIIGKFGPKTRVLESSLSTVEKYTLGLFDKYTWDYLHTGGKLMVADAYLEKARIQAAKEGKPFDEIAQRKQISAFVNDSFGGLNWFEAATQAKNEYVKRATMAAYSPEGRRAMQQILFAPDWTISTLRAFSSSLPKELFSPTKWHPVEGIKGMMAPTTKADYARLYQFKTALLYLTVLNGINMITAGRPIWENKDKSRIEWPDGTSMQAMKHAMEPYHWITDPTQTLMNKLGFLPKAAFVLGAGTEYASPSAPKLADRGPVSRIKTALGAALPFQVQAASSAPPGEGAKRALYGTMGFPMYGSTKEQKKLARTERNLTEKELSWEYHEKEIQAGREQRTKEHDNRGRVLKRRKQKLEAEKAK